MTFIVLVHLRKMGEGGGPRLSILVHTRSTINTTRYSGLTILNMLEPAVVRSPVDEAIELSLYIYIYMVLLK
jgi:hypothetical protein